MATKSLRRVLIALALTTLLWTMAAAQEDALPSPEDVVGSGGRSTGGNFVLTDRIGSPVGGVTSGGSFVLTSGVGIGSVGSSDAGTGVGAVEPKLFLPSARR
jgi:hypothetical protein